MRVLITGASGMVGRNLVNHPGISSYEVLTPSHSELNLLNYAEVEAYLQHNNPDLIIHAAGKVGGIQANIRMPVLFLLDNLDMGRNLMWAARQVGVRQVMNLGSSCMYPRQAPNPLHESYILQGELEPTNEGYALAKIVTSRLCQYISQENALFAYKTLVPCNLYGRWDKFDPAHSHLLAAAIHKIHTAKKDGLREVEIWGDGTARREFLYAGDLADFLVEAISRFDELPSVLNVGCGIDHSINEYYLAVADVIGYQGNFQHDLTKAVGMKQKLVDVTSLHSLGWRAPTSLLEGIEKTYQWYLTTKGEA
ncbi:GDP-L-fucose synthase [compost metagenome]